VKRRGFIFAASIAGAVVGVFWLFAIDAGMNGARWPPDWRTWPAHVTCPFIPLVGLNSLANLSVPVPNALAYGLVCWCILRFLRRPNSASPKPFTACVLRTCHTVSFKYDPFGRRIYKSSSTATSVFAYDGDNLIEETNSSGGVVARYTETDNIDEPLALLRSSTTSYYHADGLGSVTSLSSSSGSLAQAYGYDSFGKRLSSAGSLTGPFQYTAREFDTETSLYYYRARYYDPQTGRFLSEDPVAFQGGSNFYPYVLNQPPELHRSTGANSPSIDHSRYRSGCRGGLGILADR
jgi:RHS repeat-associated protein